MKLWRKIVPRKGDVRFKKKFAFLPLFIEDADSESGNYYWLCFYWVKQMYYDGDWHKLESHNTQLDNPEKSTNTLLRPSSKPEE